MINGQKRIIKPQHLNLWLEEKDGGVTLYYSTIKDENGEFETIFNEELDNVLGKNNPPNFYPLAWNHKVVEEYGLNEMSIANSLMINLKENNNFKRIVEMMIQNQKVGKDNSSPIYLNVSMPEQGATEVSEMFKNKQSLLSSFQLHRMR